MTDALAALVLPAALSILATVKGLRRGLNPADESYLVYGALNLRKGLVPIRDFRAYDPLRYLYCAAVFAIIGPGYVSARLAMAALGFAGVVTTVLLALAASGSVAIAALTGCMSALWQLPRFKQGENLIILLLVAGFSALPDAGGVPFLGAVLVAATFYAHNLLVYAIGAAFLFTFGQENAAAHLFAALGWAFTAVVLILIGCALFVRGYLGAFWQRKVRAVLVRGSANLPLPKPWLWRAPTQVIAQWSRPRQVIFQTIFTFLPALLVAAVGLWLSDPAATSPIHAGAAAVSLFLFHHLWSRADLGHLVTVMQPLPILLVAVLHPILPEPVLLAILALFFALSAYLLWAYADFRTIWGSGAGLARLDTRFGPLEVPQDLARRMTALVTEIENATPPGHPVLCVPLNIAALVLSDRPSAVYDCFPVYPATAAAQQTMIDELTATTPRIAIIGQQTLDSRSELVFATNYAAVMAYLDAHYTRQSGAGGDAIYLRND